MNSVKVPVVSAPMSNVTNATLAVRGTPRYRPIATHELPDLVPHRLMSASVAVLDSLQPVSIDAAIIRGDLLPLY